MQKVKCTLCDWERECETKKETDLALRTHMHRNHREGKIRRSVKYQVKDKSSYFADPLQFRIVKDEQIEFTKDSAFAFLEFETFSGERNIREGHVQFLYDEWNSGRFLWQNVMIASALCEGKEYRINGQHTCWMRCNVPDDREPLKVKVRHVTYKVDNQDQLRALYSVFDRNAPRTSGHVSRVILMETNAGKGLPPSIIGNIQSGFKMWFCEPTDKREKMSSEEVTGLILKNYPELFNQVGAFVSSHIYDAPFIKRSSVIGALFATFEKSAASTAFWDTVCTGLGLENRTDARWQLRNYLERTGHSIKGSRQVVSQEEAFRICINAWNRFRAGEQVTNLRSTDVRVKVRS